MKLEVVVLPVSDVERAKAFYDRLGWRFDGDFRTGETFRVLQYTPSGSTCSVHFGKNVTSAAPGSAQGLHLVVTDIEAARADLVARGIDASEVFHCETGYACRFPGNDAPVPGRHPEGATYGSFVSFSDPDGNAWVLQEVTTRFPGRVEGETAFTSQADLARALRRAAEAHAKHEEQTGEADANWPEWYAEYLVREQSGDALPS
jgi:catechol 2,3-dioxygenase-like lactoylglutathione lyase family enzyme